MATNTEIIFTESPDSINDQDVNENYDLDISSALLVEQVVAQLINGWFIDEINAGADAVVNEDTRFINLTGKRIEITGQEGEAGDGRRPLKFFPIDGRACVVDGEIQGLPDPESGVVYIVNEDVVKYLLTHQSEADARTVDDIVYTNGAVEIATSTKYDGSTRPDGLTDRYKSLISARALKIVPLEGSAFADRMKYLEEANNFYASWLGDNLRFNNLRFDL